jgi:hypothetical protein
MITRRGATRSSRGSTSVTARGGPRRRSRTGTIALTSLAALALVSLSVVPALGSAASTQSPIFEVTFENCNTLHIGYNRFPDGTIVHWRVNQSGTPTLASGTFTAIGGGKLGSKTYHFINIPLGITLKPEPIQSHARFFWTLNGVTTNYEVTRDPGGGPGCGTTPPPPVGSCLPSSSLSILVQGTNAVSYVPKGSWSNSTTGIAAVNVEGSSITPTLISTPNAVNSAASNPITGETVATANNTDVYVLKGTAITNTLTSGGSGVISFSGGAATNTGVVMDATNNRVVLGESVASAPGFQFLNLGAKTFNTPFTSPSGLISEDPLIDPSRNLLLSASEDGNYEIVDVSNPTAPKFFENATGGGTLDSSAEDCATGIALAGGEGSEPSSVFIADLTQAKFTPGSPSGTWTAPSQNQMLSESSLSAGASALAIAQGTHTGVVAGEFGGNAITAIKLPSTSGSGTPAIQDWVTCGIGNTPDNNAWFQGFDPHTTTAYQTPNGGDAIGLFTNGDASWLARVDLTKLLNSSIVPRTAGGHACASTTIPSTVENFVAVP